MGKEYDSLTSNFLLQNDPTSTQRCIDYLDGLTLPEFTSENTQQILTQLTSSSSASSSAQRSFLAEYAERRKRNNQAVKRCREARNKREERVTLHVFKLEQENAYLKEQKKLLEDKLRQYRLYYGQLPHGTASIRQ